MCVVFQGGVMAGMISRRRWLTAFAALMLAVLAAARPWRYSGEVAASVSLTGQPDAKCGQNITVSATVQDKDGKPIRASRSSGPGSRG